MQTGHKILTQEEHSRPYTVLSVTLFLQRVSTACYAERCISHSKSVRPSVRLSVRHTLALSQNDSSYDHGVFTGG